MVYNIVCLFVGYGFSMNHFENIIDFIADDSGGWAFNSLYADLNTQVSGGFSWLKVLNGLSLDGKVMIGGSFVIENDGCGFLRVDVDVVDGIKLTGYV